MAQRAEPAADVTQLAVAFAHAVTAGPRGCGLYAPQHPAVAIADERSMSAHTDACVGGMMQIAVTAHLSIMAR
jgi:hypothetical protein